jgi:hypothetical protein
VPGGECEVTLLLIDGSWHLAAHGHREAARSYALRSVELLGPRIEGGEARYSGLFLSALRAAELWDEYGEHARQELERFEEGTDGHTYARCAVGMASAHLGDRAEAEAIMARLLNEEEFVYAGYVAAHLGELDLAIDYFKQGVTSDSTYGYDHFARWDLDLEPLWDYPPFREMVGWDD